MKQNVKPLNGALDQLLQLKGVTFEWKDPSKHGHERETGTVNGFIAQDVEKIFPQWVNDKGYTAPDGETYRTLDTRQIEALEVESIRTLKMEVDDLKAEVKELKGNRRPLISWHPSETLVFGLGLVAMGGGFVISRRKRSEPERKA